MGSRVFLLLGLSIAFALLISSEVAARDLAEATTDGHYNGGGGGHYNGGGGHGGGGHYNGGGHHGGGGGCHHYCHGRCCSAAEAQALEGAGLDGGYHGGHGGHGGGGGHGGHGGHGGCHHYCHGSCCSAAEAQALEATTTVKPQN